MDVNGRAVSMSSKYDRRNGHGGKCLDKRGINDRANTRNKSDQSE